MYFFQNQEIFKNFCNDSYPTTTFPLLHESYYKQNHILTPYSSIPCHGRLFPAKQKKSSHNNFNYCIKIIPVYVVLILYIEYQRFVVFKILSDFCLTRQFFSDIMARTS